MLRLRRRQRFRRKESAAFIQQIEEVLGVVIADEKVQIESAEADGWKLILVGGEILALLIKDKPFLTIKGLLAHRPDRLFVTVDMGAVKYVCNGADVMCPGIVEADPAIRAGDLVWVRDIKNKQPLAVGEALATGPEMVTGKSGKGVATIHYVGDKLWKIDEE